MVLTYGRTRGNVRTHGGRSVSPADDAFGAPNARSIATRLRVSAAPSEAVAEPVGARSNAKLRRRPARCLRRPNPPFRFGGTGRTPAASAPARIAFASWLPVGDDVAGDRRAPRHPLGRPFLAALRPPQGRQPPVRGRAVAPARQVRAVALGLHAPGRPELRVAVGRVRPDADRAAVRGGGDPPAGDADDRLIQGGRQPADRAGPHPAGHGGFAGQRPAAEADRPAAAVAGAADRQAVDDGEEVDLQDAGVGKDGRAAGPGVVRAAEFGDDRLPELAPHGGLPHGGSGRKAVLPLP